MYVRPTSLPPYALLGRTSPVFVPRLTPISLDYIDRQTHEIKQDDDKTVYKSLDEIAEDLPDNTPRFVLLSYPLTLRDGRLKVPYVMLAWMPATCNHEQKMIYAGAKELLRNTAGVGDVIDITETEELEEVPARLGAT